MLRISKSKLKLKAKLLKHYKKNMAVAISAEAIERGLLLEEFCWMGLSRRTAQMVADIGPDEAAAMFEAWAALTRKGRFGDFDGTQMSKFEDLDGSLIY